MLTNLNDQTIKTLYRRVDNILANLSYKDWYNTNYNSNGKRKSKKHIPYNLSVETLEALDTLKLVNSKMSIEDEETIKTFIMKWRSIKPEYIDSRP